ncbi:MAG: hypothetical protein DRJ38_05505 [Thermoprotei archaeon]|nr:MAG: hypothetical protein DRJ38_05505 [Thermoprotei archaeon]
MFKRKVKAVSFDLDGTILRLNPPDIIIRKFLENYGILKDLEEITRVLNALTNRMEELKRLDVKSYYINLNRMILEALGIREKTYELAVLMYRDWFRFADAELYEDVIQVLEYLFRKNFKIGIISDNFSDEVWKIIREHGIDMYFSTIVTPDITGCFKPNPGIYKEFERKIGVRGSYIMHVGDDLKRDYFGALNAGFNAVLLDRAKRELTGINKIQSLYELINLLEVASL